MKRFQRDRGLAADGICGSKTWQAIRKAQEEMDIDEKWEEREC